jgi:hypothetical protein
MEDAEEGEEGAGGEGMDVQVGRYPYTLFHTVSRHHTFKRTISTPQAVV